MKYLYFNSKEELMNWYLKKIFHDERQWQKEVYKVSQTKIWTNYWRASCGGKTAPDELREKAAELLSEAIDKANYPFPICVTIEVVDAGGNWTHYKTETYRSENGRSLEREREADRIYSLIKEWEEKWKKEFVYICV